jgi:hypothetical protein
MSALVVITALLSFVLGCLTSLGEQKSKLFFNKQSPVGCLLFCVAVLAMFGVSLTIIRLVSTLLGVQSIDYRVFVGSWTVGYALLTVISRLGASHDR